MCDMSDRYVLLTPQAAADRLAEAYDVPELTPGLLDREPERQRKAGRYLPTYPVLFQDSKPVDPDMPGGGPPPDRWIYESYPWGVFPKCPYHPWVYGLPAVED